MPIDGRAAAGSEVHHNLPHAAYRLFRTICIVCVVCFAVAAARTGMSRPSDILSRQPKTTENVPGKHAPDRPGAVDASRAIVTILVSE
jgi:hypothetical protein